MDKYAQGYNVMLKLIHQWWLIQACYHQGDQLLLVAEPIKRFPFWDIADYYVDDKKAGIIPETAISVEVSNDDTPWSLGKRLLSLLDLPMITYDDYLQETDKDIRKPFCLGEKLEYDTIMPQGSHNYRKKHNMSTVPKCRAAGLHGGKKLYLEGD